MKKMTLVKLFVVKHGSLYINMYYIMYTMTPCTRRKIVFGKVLTTNSKQYNVLVIQIDFWPVQ